METKKASFWLVKIGSCIVQNFTQSVNVCAYALAIVGNACAHALAISFDKTPLVYYKHTPPIAPLVYAKAPNACTILSFFFSKRDFPKYCSYAFWIFKNANANALSEQLIFSSTKKHQNYCFTPSYIVKYQNLALTHQIEPMSMLSFSEKKSLKIWHRFIVPPKWGSKFIVILK